MTSGVVVDSVNGNGWTRSDNFTNASDQRIVLTGLEILALNPEDVGFADVVGAPPGPTNVFDVLAAAQAAHPDVISRCNNRLFK